jgi:hypothetical protein
MFQLREKQCAVSKQLFRRYIAPVIALIYGGKLKVECPDDAPAMRASPRISAYSAVFGGHPGEHAFREIHHRVFDDHFAKCFFDAVRKLELLVTIFVREP